MLVDRNALCAGFFRCLARFHRTSPGGAAHAQHCRQKWQQRATYALRTLSGGGTDKRTPARVHLKTAFCGCVNALGSDRATKPRGRSIGIIQNLKASKCKRHWREKLRSRDNVISWLQPHGKGSVGRLAYAGSSEFSRPRSDRPSTSGLG